MLSNSFYFPLSSASASRRVKDPANCRHLLCPALTCLGTLAFPSMPSMRNQPAELMQVGCWWRFIIDGNEGGLLYTVCVCLHVCVRACACICTCITHSAVMLCICLTSSLCIGTYLTYRHPAKLHPSASPGDWPAVG